MIKELTVERVQPLLAPRSIGRNRILSTLARDDGGKERGASPVPTQKFSRVALAELTRASIRRRRPTMVGRLWKIKRSKPTLVSRDKRLLHGTYRRTQRLFYSDRSRLARLILDKVKEGLCPIGNIGVEKYFGGSPRRVSRV